MRVRLDGQSHPLRRVLDLGPERGSLGAVEHHVFGSPEGEKGVEIQGHRGLS
jgi:hypothetical protein